MRTKCDKNSGWKMRDLKKLCRTKMQEWKTRDQNAGEKSARLVAEPHKARGLLMAALWNRAGHYIFALWFLSSLFLSLFLT